MFSENGIQYDSQQKKNLIKVFKPDISIFFISKSVEKISAGSVSKSAFYLCREAIREVSFEKGSNLNQIGDSIFEKTKVNKVDFTNCTKLLTISKKAFKDCNSLQTVILPPNVKTLRGGSFYKASPISKITLPDSLEEMPYDEFGVFHDSTLSKVIISESSHLKSLGHHAFTRTRLTTFTFGSELASVGASVFSDSRISSFTVHNGSTHFETDGTTLFNVGRTTIYTIVPIHSGIYEIPDTVVTLGYQALRYAKFTEIHFPNHKFILEDISLANTHFTTIEIPDGTERIPGSCFSYAKLQSITLPSSITSIGRQAFEYCTNLNSIDLKEGLTKIEDSAFVGCTSLTTITIPKSVTLFGSAVFTKCRKDLKVDFLNKEKFSIVQNMVIVDGIKLVEYFGSDPNDEIVMPSYITSIPDNVFTSAQLKTVHFNESTSMKIGKLSFYRSTIKTITLPACLTHIGIQCFQESQLETIVFDGTLTEIPQNCFSHCASLRAFTMQCTTLKSLSINAFANTVSLTTIDFGENAIERINESCFIDSGIKNIEIPSTVSEIGQYAFSRSSLETIVFNNVMETLPLFCLASCKSLKTVTFNSAIQNLDIYSISDCPLLNNVELSTATQSISSYAFSGCTSLEYITIPQGSNLKRIFPFAFDGCNKLTRFEILSSEFAFDEGCLMDADKTELIFFLPTTEQKFFVVPATIKTIRDYSFQSCTSLREIIVPDGVITHIGVNAFDNCTNLIRVVLPKSLKTIGKDAFINCKSLKCGSIFMKNDPQIINQVNQSGISMDILSEYCLNNYIFDKLNRITCNNEKHSPYNVLSLGFMMITTLFLC